MGTIEPLLAKSIGTRGSGSVLGKPAGFTNLLITELVYQSSMSNLKLAFRMLVKTPFVSLVAILSLALENRLKYRDYFGVRSAAQAATARRGPIPPRQPGSARAQVGIHVLQHGGIVRSGVQLPDVPGPRERADAVHEPGRPPPVRGEPGSRRSDLHRRRPGRVQGLLPHARHPAGARTVHRTGRRPGGGRRPRRGAELWVLAGPVRRQSGCPHDAAHRQRPDDDDRRGGAARLQRHHAWRTADGVRADYAA